MQRLLVIGIGVGVGVGIARGVAKGVAGGVVGGVVGGVARNVGVGVARGIAGGAALGLVSGRAFGVAFGVAFGLTFGLCFITADFRLPAYSLEAILTLFCARTATLLPSSSKRLSLLLPYRYHDIIYLPLPGLRSFFVSLADHDPVLALTLIAEATETIAQKRNALRALYDLRASALSRAARDRLWAQASSFELPFLPKPNDVPNDSPLSRFLATACDVNAAKLSTDQLRKRRSLERARETIQAFSFSIHEKRKPSDEERILLPVASLWRSAIDDELHALATEEQESPQIPNPYEPGPALDPAKDGSLFKGRSDLVQLIDHDLADHRRAPLLLTGQRRMGKTSLLQMLPVRLGTGTTIVPINFQGLSGNAHKTSPHRWIAEAIHQSAKGDLPAPPATDAWNDTLTWLLAVEPKLGKTRVLVAIDEVEKLQEGIDEGWGSAAFLDFLRAAGDKLRSIRLLLVSASPLHRLGRAWTSRLISVIHRSISYLTPDEARDLMLHPWPNFPDIYPPGGVDRWIALTSGHPYLIQLLCDALIRDLNSRQKRSANDDDMARAEDRALVDTVLFQEIWDSRTHEERTVLRTLSRGEPLAEEEHAIAIQSLLEEGFLVRSDEGALRVAVPLMARWFKRRPG